MSNTLHRFFKCTKATAAVEAAIFTPIFLTLTLGVTDLGSGMFVRMTVNAATQAGAAYAIKHSCGATCLTNIKTAMNDAVGDPTFCNGSPRKATCTATITQPCNTPCVVTVSASYPFTPILADAVYSWAQLLTVSSTVTARIL
jgi:Flp pilus assembly protein TadG